MKKWTIILAMILSVIGLPEIGFAQQDPQAGQDQGQSGLDKVRSLEVAYLSEKMNLTPAEAEKFWPVYNSYIAELQQLINARKQTLHAQGTSTDAQAAQALKDEFIFREKALAIQEKYKNQFLQVLPPRKVAIFYKSRQEFRNKVLNELNRRQAMQKQRFNNNIQHRRPLHPGHPRN
ncbi:MAG TPA: hypothetical protein VNE41_08550 [Chitinophagaceae bacterium]|nr:hypothetical protein [Chitinophagaceae bacterium]